MGTSTSARSHERPGDGVSPGVCRDGKITPEPPEERRPHGRAVEPAASSNEWGARLARPAAKEGGTAGPVRPRPSVT